VVGSSCRPGWPRLLRSCVGEACAAPGACSVWPPV
jgi:hypothetical protein